MKAIEIRGLRVDADRRPILGPLDLSVEPGALTLVSGPSGSGKTTLLRAIAGLLPPHEGELHLFGELASSRGRVRLAPERRGIGMVFQGGAHWPHLTARRAVEFVLRSRGVPRAARAPRAAELLELCELSARADARPGELSGGEGQRLALARALAGAPRLLLLDEPLGALDPELRADMAARLLELQRRLALTVVWVSHDAFELGQAAVQRVRLRAGRREEGST